MSTDPDLLDVIDALLAVHRAPSWAKDRPYGQQSLSSEEVARAEIAERYDHLVGDLINRSHR